ncbi:hypothetical protein WOLCODRAFT_164556 [Wolfiporia cocos MD-104 SS10]|uniref:RING-type domain-containing protein n=1 Tax=Wolfiporia cocos (strain MD-104) TaxID=742152 RepID=A0A2H3JXF0_WOLCO|nr:hypothetical protein WOLCODRAFT_164556 [Wolfiporia cocos MD-104 SS10]
MSAAYTYVDTPNPNLVCCICRAPFLDPCTTRTCCHTFCYDCIARALSVTPQCPIDRCPLSIDDLAAADPVIRNLVDEMVVECPQRSAGCGYTSQRLLMAAHLRDTCDFIDVPCPEALCEGVMRKDAAHHNHALGRATVEATPTNLPSDSAHTSPDLAATETLVAENAMLRLRLSALEGMVNVMRQELQDVQRALGPWYRPRVADTQSSPNQGELRPETSSTSPSAPPVAPFSTASSNESNDTTRTEHASAPRPTGLTSDVSSTDFASYFPSAEEVDVDVYSPNLLRSVSQGQPLPPRRATAMHASASEQRSAPAPPQPQPQPTQPVFSPATFSPIYPHGPSSFGTPLAYSTPSAALPPTAIQVPPLDPTQPLPHTLASLHASLASLAGALGALASTRAQESLYTGEELRSLRAGVHGLRMQMHDMLTPRAVPREPAMATTSTGGSVGEGVMPAGIGQLAWLAHGPRPFGPPPLPPSVTKL